MTIRVRTAGEGYDIELGRGCLSRAGELLDLDRKVLVVTDSGVPKEYAQCVADRCGEHVLAVLPQGEQSKSLANFEKLLREMLSAGFTRKDCVCAVGGGVPGDLAGFAAACYMRGIDFYNIPTTVLSQVDSSIGGKTAVDLDGSKNAVGAYWQPKKVLIDPETLATLPKRQVANGLAEAVKTGMIADAELFRLFEEGKAEEEIDRVIASSLAVKKRVVEEDEREAGRRKILNFGHTIGHGIESVTGLLHGESVAAGMLPMCAPGAGERLRSVLVSLGLPTRVKADPQAVYAAMLHDKKMAGGRISAVFVEEPGSCVIREVLPETLLESLKTVVGL